MPSIPSCDFQESPVFALEYSSVKGSQLTALWGSSQIKNVFSWWTTFLEEGELDSLIVKFYELQIFCGILILSRASL